MTIEVHREKVLGLAKEFEKKSTSNISKPDPSIFKSDTPIEKVIDHILTQILKININSEKFILILKDNLIINFGILCEILPTDLNRLNLPIAFESQLKKIIVNSKKNSYNKNPITKITNKTKDDMINYWEKITKDRTIFTHKKNNYINSLNNLIDKFHQKYFEVDKLMEQKLEKMKESDKAKILFKIINLIIKYIENPLLIEENLENIATDHLITNLGKINPKNFAWSLSEAIEENELKKYWFVISKKIIKKINKKYDEVMDRLVFRAYLKKKAKWSKSIIKFYPEKIKIYEYKTDKLELELKMDSILNCSILEQSDVRFEKPTPYCIELSLHKDLFICMENDEELKKLNRIFELILKTNYNN